LIGTAVRGKKIFLGISASVENFAIYNQKKTPLPFGRGVLRAITGRRIHHPQPGTRSRHRLPEREPRRGPASLPERELQLEPELEPELKLEPELAPGLAQQPEQAQGQEPSHHGLRRPH